MGVKTKRTSTKSRRSLAKGQIWKTKDGNIQIVELGKVLVHYKLLKELGQIRSVQMSRIEIMQEYLEANKARLLEDVFYD